ncbi:MAG: sensor histidine kinase [Myxococcaceae bacterium]
MPGLMRAASVEALSRGRVTPERLAIIALLFIAFAALFVPVHRAGSYAAGSLTLIWVVPAGILLGFRGGVVAGSLGFPLAVLVRFLAFGDTGPIMANWYAEVVLVLAGGGAGWGRGLVDRFRQEISQRLAAEAGLAKALAGAERASEAKTSFLARMSHELRTPLTSIRGYAELLLDDANHGRTSPSLGEDLGRILSATRHLTALIEDLLDVAKIEAGKLVLCSDEVELAPLVEDVAAVVRPLAEANGNRLELDLAQAPARLRTDPTRLRQVLLNLVSNAAKFTEDGRIGVTVGEAQREGAWWVELAVSDSGVGMSPEEAAGLFQDFYQVRAAGRNEGGSGLGLAISKQLCVAMGGDISVKSERGKGSTFVVSLPADVSRPTT